MVTSGRNWQRLAVSMVVLASVCGCAARPMVQYVPQRVEVPVIEKPPAIAVPAPPRLAIQELTPSSSDAEMMAAWVASVEQLKADDQRLRALIAPYTGGSQTAGAP